MKHKLKQFIALMGTALLGNHSTVVADSLPENAYPEHHQNSGNDSFLSKLSLPTEPRKAHTRTTRDSGSQGGVSFSRQNYTIDEGDYYGATITLVRTDCDKEGSPVSANYTSHHGTASDNDYVTANGTMIWSSADATGNCGHRSFYVQVTNDTEIEDNETVHLKLSDPTDGATLGISEATLTIIDNDSNSIGFSQPNYHVTEKGEIATITVERTQCTPETTSPASVWYEVNESDNTATDGNDYEGGNKTLLRWEEGDCDSKKVEIPIINDSEIEGDETVHLQLSDPSQATLSQSNAVLTIIDDEANESSSGGISFSQEHYTINEGNYYGATITLIRSNCDPNGPSVSAQYTSRHGTTSDDDYVVVNKTMTWSSADATGNCGPRPFYLQVNNDTQLEGNETVHLELSNPTSGAILGRSEAVLTIIDDDSNTTPELKPNDSVVDEVVDTNVARLTFSQENYQVDENTDSVRITVRHSNCQADSPPVSVKYATNSNGTASSGSDYRAVNGTLTLAGGTANACGSTYCGSDSFDIPIIDDNIVENDETIPLKLSNPSENATLTQSTATVTIIDNDVASVGSAIIVAGVAQSEDSLLPYSHEYTQRLSSLLTERGFGEEDIYVFNAQQLNEEGVALNVALTKIFEKAANNLRAGQQFVFYWHGHAFFDHLKQGNDNLSARQLSHLLSQIPAEIQQVIIIDSCYSGSFLDELKGVSNRMVLTSTNDFDTIWKMRDGRSFSDHLIRELRRGETLGNAFVSAKEMITSDPKWFRNQDPWLDDNTDGQYTLEDGSLASQTYLGREGVHAATPPSIVEVHPPITLMGDIATATLWVKVIPNRAEAINQVRAVLINPDLPFSEYQGEGTDFARPELQLRYNGAQQRYEGEYDYFCTGGKWRISYQLQSKEEIWSDIQFSEIQQAQDIQASLCLVPVTTKMSLNQTRYIAGDSLRLDMTINGIGEANLYAAIVFPDNNFITIAYPDKLSFLNTAQAYLPAVNIDGKKVYPILNLEIPTSWALGSYSVCGVLMPSETTDVLNQNSWIHWDCAGFKVEKPNSEGATNFPAEVENPNAVEKPNSDATTDLSTFRDTLQDGSLGPEMVWILAGTFRMGDIQGGGDYDEQPVHEVSVERFAMGRYEVSNAEFVHFLNTVKRRGTEEKPWFETQAEDGDSHIIGLPGNFEVETGYENHPMIEVSWYGATAYAEWLSQQTGHQYRLPTEAEWEYAARAGTETKYWWGNEIGSNRADCSNYFCGDSFYNTAPVGSFAANPFGLYDTVGNVWEWTCSEYKNKYNGEEEYCVSNAGSLSFRGGAWDGDAGGLRSAYRFRGEPTDRNGLVGFRVARL